MSTIPLKEAIAAGAWLECHAKYYDEDLHFRLRAVAFNRTSVEEIDRTQVSEVIVDGILWLLFIEVVNLAKTPTVACRIAWSIKLIDQDGFEFGSFQCSNLENVKSLGLHRFSGWSDNPPLSPKIKASGSIAFVLPDEETDYYLAIRMFPSFKDGNIREA